MADFFWFSDAQWERIAPLLPTDVRGKPRVDDRRVLSGIVHALRCGGRWSDCPEHVYGPKKTLYNRFVRWAERGIWERIFSALAGAEGTPNRLFIDSSCIKVHRCAGGGKGGLGPWYRPHQGRPQHQAPRRLRRERPASRSHADAGQRARLQGARTCIEALPPSAQLVADKGYDSQGLREWLPRRGTQAVIPPRRNRKLQYNYDRAIYKQRNVIERMFCRLKDWRRLATRFDRNIDNFMSAVALAAAVLWWL